MDDQYVIGTRLIPTTYKLLDISRPTDKISAQPTFWDPVIEALPTLAPGTYLGSECMDFYLRTYWMKEGTRSKMWFLSLEAIRCFSTMQGPDDEELEHLRRELCLPVGDMVQRPIVFVKWFTDHYFTVVMDYDKNVAYVFGRRITKDDSGVSVVKDWTEWGGDLIWKHLPRLFHNNYQMDPGLILAVDWPQVCVICGHDLTTTKKLMGD